MSKVKQQHYIPRMYLKRFTDENNRFTVWKVKDDEALFRQVPKDFASINYFYDTNNKELRKALSSNIHHFPNLKGKIDFDDEQFIEKFLSRIENNTEKVLNELNENFEAIHNEENMVQLIVFFHLLTYRTEKYHNVMNDINNVTITHIEKTKMSQFTNEINSDAKTTQLTSMMDLGSLCKTALMFKLNYDCYVASVSGVTKLLISDNPTQGIMQGFNDICIPISSENALIFRVKNKSAPLISKDMPVEGKIELSEQSVMSYNAMQLSYANRFIFGNKDSIEKLKDFCDSFGGYRSIFKC